MADVNLAGIFSKPGGIMEQASLLEDLSYLYDERFLNKYAGSIITDPSTAIVELVANCWDAYATEVQITLPDRKQGRHFKDARARGKALADALLFSERVRHGHSVRQYG